MDHREESGINSDEGATLCRPMVVPKSAKTLSIVTAVLTLLLAATIASNPIDTTVKVALIGLGIILNGVLIIIIKYSFSGDICVSGDSLEIRKRGTRRSIPLKFIKGARATTVGEARGPKDDTPALYVELDPKAPFLFKLRHGFIRYLILPTLHAEELAERIQEAPSRRNSWRKVLRRRVKRPKHRKLKIAVIILYLVVIIGALQFLQDLKEKDYFEFFDIAVINEGDNTSKLLFHAKYVNVDRTKNQTGFGWSTYDPEIYDVAAWDGEGPINFTVKRGFIDIDYRRNVSKNETYEFWFTFKQKRTREYADFVVQGSVMEYRINLTYAQPVKIHWIEPAADEIIHDGNLTLRWVLTDMDAMPHTVAARHVRNGLDPENIDLRFSNTRNTRIEDAIERYRGCDNEYLRPALHANYYALLRAENRDYINNMLMGITDIAFGLLLLSLVWITYAFRDHGRQILPIYIFVLFPYGVIAILGYGSVYPLLLPYSIAMAALLYSNLSRKNIDVFDTLTASSGFLKLLSRLASSFIIFFLIFLILGGYFPHGLIKHATFDILFPFLLFGTNIYINREIINHNRLTELIQKVHEMEGIADDTFILPEVFSDKIIRLGEEATVYRFDDQGNVYLEGSTIFREGTVDRRDFFNKVLKIGFFIFYLITSYLFGTFGYSEPLLSLMFFFLLMSISFRI